MNLNDLEKLANAALDTNRTTKEQFEALDDFHAAMTPTKALEMIEVCRQAQSWKASRYVPNC